MNLILSMLVLWGAAVGCTKNRAPVPAPPTEASLPNEALISGDLLPGVKKIAIIGDSLTEGYGVDASESFGQVLENLLHEQGRPDLSVQSLGGSGSTSASGPSRVRWALQGEPDLIILALGANDGLRGLAVDQLKENLIETVRAAKEAGVQVVLAGMKAPPNLGRAYTQSYEAVFHEVAAEEQIPLMPFLLEGVAGVDEFNIDDGIHPNAKGHQIMGNNLFLFLKEQNF